jgi:predicted CXXCH cytochrome family protein
MNSGAAAEGQTRTALLRPVPRAAALLAVAVAAFILAPPAEAQLKKGRVYKAQQKSCADCHGKEIKEFERRRTVHAPVAAGECESCHLRHGVVGLLRLSSEDPKLCLSCHAGAGGAATEPGATGQWPAGAGHEIVHPPGDNLKCGTCHDPHGSDGPSLLRARDPAMCLSCHPAAEHEGLSGHSEAGIGCLTCHDPHGKGKSGSLRSPASELCVSCHDGSSGAEKKGHGGGAPGGATCLSCHGPHASATKGIMLPNVHGALADGGGSCATCHAKAGAPGEPWTLSAAGAELCVTCHEDPRQAGEGERVHGALGDGTCLTCHTPHASKENALLAGSQVEVCGACHVEAESAVKAPFPHAPAGESCTSCHQPHTGGEHLLGTPTPGLCLTCHGDVAEQTSRAHPHPPAAGECLTCHDPHGTGHKGILRNAQKDLCVSCHDGIAAHNEARVTHPPVVEGRCTSCHEPHGSEAAHLVPADVSKACMACHKSVEISMAGSGRHAPYKEGECLSCHEPHSSSRAGLLAVEPLQLCRTCHEESAEDKAAWSRHLPVKRGQCLSCHGPHGGFEPGLQRRGDGRTLCVSCHTEQGEVMSRKDLTVHEPFSEGSCLTCHVPHASNHVPLLADAPGTLCGNCHDITDRRMTQSHRGLVSTGTDCTGCHEPHASEGEKLMLPGQHAPFAERECGSCHHGGTAP